VFFFFSSRRRHTRSKRDWSSDVCSSDLPPDDVRDWRVHDVDRIDYIAGHLQAALDATGQDGQARGMDLRGFFIWSLLDNWEWAAGFTQRFGLVHVDFETGRRTPKDSYYWLQQELGRRRVR